MKVITASSTLFLSAFIALAATPSADEVLAQAKAKASAEHKTIFLHFGASWCIWCRRLEGFLDRSDSKPVFEKYFVPVKLDVQEHDQQKALENPGAEDLMKQLGASGGLPYSAFLDSHGALIANSKLNGENIGFPGEPQELDWFVQMMKKASPDITDGDVKTLVAALKSSKSQP